MEGIKALHIFDLTFLLNNFTFLAEKDGRMSDFFNKKI